MYILVRIRVAVAVAVLTKKNMRGRAAKDETELEGSELESRKISGGTRGVRYEAMRKAKKMRCERPDPDDSANT